MKCKKIALLLVIVLLIGANGVFAKDLCASEYEVGIRAVSAPTSEPSSYPYEGSWDGTSNYTYTKYYFTSSTFYAKADGKFSVKYYYDNGEYISTQKATYDSYSKKYVISALVNGLGGRKYYCKIYNKASGSASGTSYIVSTAY
ncbi:hypothetical protein PV797_17220 [Clostridiaceae bacterium M8S5]|nr:hypothetical protein PV797_17220 [Clostridiaceae bacterium M8S5]